MLVKDNEMKDVQEKIELQVRFEDMIIMALTKLVLYTRKSSKLDLEKFYNSLGEENGTLLGNNADLLCFLLSKHFPVA